MQVEELHELVLLLLAPDPLEFEDATEVGFAPVRDVDEIGLDQGFRRRWPDLYCLEKSIDFGKAGVHPLHEPGRGRSR